MNRKAITIIAATIVAFSLNAASCEQLAPTPAVDQIVTFDDADPGCELGVVQTLGGCVTPDQAPPVSDPPSTEGLGY